MIEFFAVQWTNELFEDFWVEKTVMKENCKLQDGLSSKELDLLQLLCGVHSDKLCQELLKEINPRIIKLIQVACNWIDGVEMDKDFKATQGKLQLQERSGPGESSRRLKKSPPRRIWVRTQNQARQRQAEEDLL